MTYYVVWFRNSPPDSWMFADEIVIHNTYQSIPRLHPTKDRADARAVEIKKASESVQIEVRVTEVTIDPPGGRVMRYYVVWFRNSTDGPWFSADNAALPNSYESCPLGHMTKEKAEERAEEIKKESLSATIQVRITEVVINPPPNEG